jgi:hypothetical protein
LLGTEQTLAVLNSSLPAAPKEIIDHAVRLSSGYIKLALFIALELSARPDIPVTALAQIYDVRQFLKRIVSDEMREALKVMSVLTRTGWEQGLEDEVKSVAKFLKMNMTDLRKHVRQLEIKGLIAKQGRYRYVTPHLLAISAAAEVWEENGSSLLALWQKLPHASSGRAMLERLAMMGEHPQVRSAVETLLSSDGPFRSIVDLEDTNRTEVFRILTSAAPAGALKALQRILGDLPRDRLLNLSAGRHNVIGGLELLIWHPFTFAGAARLLRKLAEAENEKIGKTATRIWARIFQVHLSGTAVPALERHQLMKEALTDN